MNNFDTLNFDKHIHVDVVLSDHTNYNVLEFKLIRKH